jgi:Holliday junction resolvasome RuvABC endonuclease subunit
MKTLGVDGAACTGLALVGGEDHRGKTVEVPHERGHLRLQLIANEVARTLQIWQPEFAAIEGYAFVRNIRSFVTLVSIGTIIRDTLYRSRIPWVEVPPAVLKRWTTGHGNATKAHMAASVKERWAYASHSHDIVDAFALAQMCQMGWDALVGIPGVAVGWSEHKE